MEIAKSFLSENNTKLIRINPDIEDEFEEIIKINLGAKKALRMLNMR